MDFENLSHAVNTVIKNPESLTFTVLDQILVEKIRSSNELNSSIKKKITKIPYSMNSEQKKALTLMYPEFEFEYGVNFSGHVLAAASRICETKLIWDFIHLDDVERIKERIPQYDHYITDIGGNFLTNLKCGKVKGMHSCEPTLSLYDSTRRTDRIIGSLFLDPSKLNNDSNDVLTSFDKFNNFRCERKFQNCNYTSFLGMSIHSAYDIPLQDFIDGMDNKNMMCAYLTMIFDPKMLHTDSDKLLDIEMKWSIRGETIHFEYYNESSLSYTHNLANYLSYFTQSHMISTVNKRHYTLQILKNRGYIHFIKILYVDDTGFNRTPLVHSIPFSYYENMVGIKYFVWTELMKENMSKDRIRGLLKPILLIYPEVEIEHYKSFAYKLEAGKFNPSTIFEFILSQKYRSQQDQKNVAQGKLGNVTELFFLAHAVYLLIYKLRYTNGNVLKHLISEQLDSRKASNINFLKKMFSKVSAKIRKAYLKLYVKFQSPPEILEVTFSKIQEYRSFSDVKTNVKSADWVYGFTEIDPSWCIYEPKRSSVLDTILQNSDETEIYTIDNTNKEVKSEPFSIEKHTNEHFDGAGVTIVIDELKPGVNRYPVGSIMDCDGKCKDLEVIPNSGGGYCIYYSMLGYDDKEAAITLIKKFRSMDFNDYKDDIKIKMRKSLSLKGGLVTELVFDLFSILEKLKIFVHTRDCKHVRFYGNEKWEDEIHILYHDNHFERLDLPDSKKFTKYGEGHKPIDLGLLSRKREEGKSDVTTSKEEDKKGNSNNVITSKKGDKNIIASKEDEFDHTGGGDTSDDDESITEEELENSSDDDVFIDKMFDKNNMSKLETCIKFGKNLFKDNRHHSKETLCIIKSLCDNGVFKQVYDENLIYKTTFEDIPRIQNICYVEQDSPIKDFEKIKFLPNMFYRFVHISKKNLVIIHVSEGCNYMNNDINIKELKSHVFLDFDMYYISDHLKRTVKFFEKTGLSTVRTYPEFYELSNKRVFVTCNQGYKDKYFYKNFLSKQFAERNFINKERIEKVYVFDPYYKITPVNMRKYIGLYNEKVDRNADDKIFSMVERCIKLNTVKGTNVLLHLHTSTVKILEQFVRDFIKLPQDNVILVIYDTDYYKTIHRKLLKYSYSVNDNVSNFDLMEKISSLSISPFKTIIDKLTPEDFISNKRKFLKLNNRPLDSSAVYKIDEILKEYNYTPEVIIDICANPGNFSKILRCKYPSAILYIHSYFNSKTCDIIDPVFVNAKNTILINKRMTNNYHGDLLDESQFKYVDSMLKMADLITSDGCVDAGPDSWCNIKLTRNQIRLALNHLNIGGVFILKVFIHHNIYELLKTTSRKFHKTTIIKPHYSNIISPEYYIYFDGYSGKIHGETLSDVDIYKAYVTYYKYIKEFSEHCDEDDGFQNGSIENESKSGKFTRIKEKEKEFKIKDSPVFNSSLQELYNIYVKDKSETNKTRLLMEMQESGLFDESVLLKCDQTGCFEDFNSEKLRIIETKDCRIEKYNNESYNLKPLSSISDKLPGIKNKDLLKHWSKNNVKNKFDPYLEYEEKLGYVQRNASREILEVYKTTPKIIREILEILYKQKKINLVLGEYQVRYIRLDDSNIGVWDNKIKSWRIKPEGNLKYDVYFDGKDFVKSDNLDSTDVRYLMVNNSCEFIHEISLYDSLKDINIYDNITDVDVKFVQGVPGCGKTTYICSNVNDGDLILASTREGVKSIESKIKKNVVIKTLHSYLMNPNKQFETVWIDEFLMRHYGEIILVILKSKCKRIVLIGDKAQIPYFNKCPSFLLNYSKSTDFITPTENKNVSYRCPLDVAYMFYEDYENGFMSVSKFSKTMKTKLINSPLDIPKNEGYKYLVFKQSEKTTLLMEGFKDVSTIGETQGLEFKKVCLVRLSKIAIDELYNRRDQQLVGCTRHREEFVYCSIIKDGLFELINKLPTEDEIKQKVSIITSRFNGAGRRRRVNMKNLTVGDLRLVKPLVINDLKFSEYFNKVILDMPKPVHTDKSLQLIVDTVNTNGGNLISNIQPKVTYKIQRPDSQFRCITKGLGISYLQDVYDKILPGNSCFDYKYDQLIAESQPIFFPYKNVIVDHSKDYPLPDHKPSLSPVLRTSMAYDRLPSQMDSLIGLMKRNLGIPQLSGVVDIKYFVDNCVENFLSTYIDVDKLDIFNMYENDMLYPEVNSVREWLSDQDNKNLGSIKEPFDIFDPSLDLFVYDLMNKQQIKPGLTTQTPYEYSAVQTIASQNKSLNMFWCPIFRNCKRRLRAVLKENFMIFADMSADDFTKILSDRFPVRYLQSYKKLEIDIGKYDKSQHRLLFEVECALYKKLGIPDELILKWREAHEFTTLKDRKNGVKAFVEYQRKSGDASTFFGNTVVLMVVLCTIFDLSDSFGVFSGDDSILWMKDIIDRNDLCANIFNLESKFYKFENSYFCSKFLIEVKDQWFLIPDPLKILTKLGRHNISNWDHLEEYRISLCDLLSIYKRGEIYDALNVAFCERYKINFSIEPLCVSILELISTKNNFKTLFYVKPGVKLITDPSHKKLD
nr:MAG: RNA-dependent RNA polymerase [Culex pipiens-associated Tunisia virus]